MFEDHWTDFHEEVLELINRVHKHTEKSPMPDWPFKRETLYHYYNRWYIDELDDGPVVFDHTRLGAFVAGDLEKPPGSHYDSYYDKEVFDDDSDDFFGRLDNCPHKEKLKIYTLGDPLNIQTITINWVHFWRAYEHLTDPYDEFIQWLVDEGIT
jgi:hypothetical protein